MSNQGPVVGCISLSNRGHDYLHRLTHVAPEREGNEPQKPAAMAEFYANHPTLARCVFVPIAFVRGILKPLLFVVNCLAMTIIFPIMGAYYAVRGENAKSCEHIKAGLLNLLGTGAVIAFLVVSAYYIPLAASASIYLTATVVSITVLVYRASEDPEGTDDVRRALAEKNKKAAPDPIVVTVTPTEPTPAHPTGGSTGAPAQPPPTEPGPQFTLPPSRPAVQVLPGGGTITTTVTVSELPNEGNPFPFPPPVAARPAPPLGGGNPFAPGETNLFNQTPPAPLPQDQGQGLGAHATLFAAIGAPPPPPLHQGPALNPFAPPPPPAAASVDSLSAVASFVALNGSSDSSGMLPEQGGDGILGVGESTVLVSASMTASNVSDAPAPAGHDFEVASSDAAALAGNDSGAPEAPPAPPVPEEGEVNAAVYAAAAAGVAVGPAPAPATAGARAAPRPRPTTGLVLSGDLLAAHLSSMKEAAKKKKEEATPPAQAGSGAAPATVQSAQAGSRAAPATVQPKSKAPPGGGVSMAEIARLAQEASARRSFQDPKSAHKPLPPPIAPAPELAIQLRPTQRAGQGAGPTGAHPPTPPPGNPFANILKSSRSGAGSASAAASSSVPAVPVSAVGVGGSVAARAAMFGGPSPSTLSAASTTAAASSSSASIKTQVVGVTSSSQTPAAPAAAPAPTPSSSASSSSVTTAVSAGTPLPARPVLRLPTSALSASAFASSSSASASVSTSGAQQRADGNAGAPAAAQGGTGGASGAAVSAAQLAQHLAQHLHERHVSMNGGNLHDSMTLLADSVVLGDGGLVGSSSIRLGESHEEASSAALSSSKGSASILSSKNLSALSNSLPDHVRNKEDPSETGSGSEDDFS